MKVVVVGAGISGLTAAVLLKEQGHQVEVFETSNFLGGHCRDVLMQGIMVQLYGPHIFHTNDLACWNFVNRYTEFANYHHTVMANTDAGMFNIPFNFFSEKMLRRDLSDGELVNLVYKGYSEKMWGMAWEDLPAVIRNRVPARREGLDVRYTTDMYHGVPAHGYHKMFEAMAEGLTVYLAAGLNDWKHQKADLVIYTGKLDEYFGYSLGKLGYRSIRFETKAEMKKVHPIINECRVSVPWTRVTDHHFWPGGEGSYNTFITYEYPCEHNDSNDSYYPKPWGTHAELALKYMGMAAEEAGVTFFGRLATYCYLDMNMVVERALREFKA